jgi:hypothetical protein
LLNLSSNNNATLLLTTGASPWQVCEGVEHAFRPEK